MSDHSPAEDDDNDMAIDPGLAAAMGFSGFGAQPNAKRRKFKHDDAVVDIAGSALAAQSNGRKSDKGSAGSGANKTAIGVRGSVKEAVVRDEVQGVRSQGETPQPQGQLVAQSMSAVEQQASRDEVLRGLGTKTPQELEALRNGVRLPGGDVVYFMHSFLENPWVGLRAEGDRGK